MASRVAPLVGMFKINIQLFTSAGPTILARLNELGAGLFLDLKFHDIPNTVIGGVSSAIGLPGVRFIDLHALGGLEMMVAAAKARDSANGSKSPPTKLLAITILTSMDNPALRRVGIGGPASKRVVQLAELARRAGMDGVVASPQEVRAIRRACGEDFLIVVPGIRPAPDSTRKPSKKGRGDDQARIATPFEAIRSGADYLVIGRPITAAPDPEAAARAILEEVGSALPPG